MHPHFARGELDVGNIPWKDPSFYKKCQLFPNRLKKRQKSKIFTFFFLLSKLCYHGKKQNLKSKCHPLLALPSVSFTRAAIQNLDNFLNLWEQSQKASPMPCRLLGSNYLVDYLFVIKGFWLMFRDVTVLPMRGPVYSATSVFDASVNAWRKRDLPPIWVWFSIFL